MSLHLNQLRQKEVILTKRNGELQTDLTIANNSLSDAKNQLVSLQEQISTLQNELQARNDAIVKLERRIQFLTKERDGCIHVLNSYRRDDGASSILKEQVNELEVSNGRLNERIKELESQLDNIQRK
jgi:chromosome segregation ATPase